MLLGPFLEPFIEVVKIDRDFDPLVRVTAARVITIIIVILFMDSPLFLFIIFAPRWPSRFLLLPLGRALQRLRTL